MNKFTKEEEYLLDKLGSKASMNTFELRSLGICNPNNVICNLRKKGIAIRTIKKDTLDLFGNIRKRVAHYLLEEYKNGNV